MNATSSVQQQYIDSYPVGRRIHLWALRKRGVSRQIAEDIVQQAWLQAWRKLDQFRGDCLLQSWVFVIVINFLRNHIRQQHGESAMQDIYEAQLLTHPFKQLETELDLTKILSRCSRRDAVMLRECYLDQETLGDAAAHLGLKESTLRVRLMRAREHARNLL